MINNNHKFFPDLLFLSVTMKCCAFCFARQFLADDCFTLGVPPHAMPPDTDYPD
jgi:hypothetical protein